MDANELYGKLKDFQEKKGYFFNRDTKMVMELLEMLLVNKERYGHMACPCRLASGDFAMDKDIVCPCAYREEDVKEYGSCFCGLYVSREFNDGLLPVRVVPERRPAEKVLAALGLD